MATDVLNTDLRVNPNGVGMPSHRTYNPVYQPFIDIKFKDLLPSAADLVALWDIPQGFFIAGIGVHVFTAVTSPTSGITLDIGDYSYTDDIDEGDTLTEVDADGYLDGMDVHTAGYYSSFPAGATAHAQGKFYASAHRVIAMLVIGDAPVNGVIRVGLTGWYAQPPYTVLTA